MKNFHPLRLVQQLSATWGEEAMNFPFPQLLETRGEHLQAHTLKSGRCIAENRYTLAFFDAWGSTDGCRERVLMLSAVPEGEKGKVSPTLANKLIYWTPIALVRIRKELLA